MQQIALAARPGRIDLVVELPFPDAEGRRRLIELYARGLDLEWVSKRRAGRPRHTPVDAVGQHVYVDQGGRTSTSKLTSYLQDVRSAYLWFEGRPRPRRHK